MPASGHCFVSYAVSSRGVDMITTPMLRHYTNSIALACHSTPSNVRGHIARYGLRAMQ